jgi:hypothetical protein
VQELYTDSLSVESSPFLLRDGVPHEGTRNCLPVIRRWAWAPDECLVSRHTGRLTVDRNMNLSVGVERIMLCV